jgi:monoamine oxidase
MELRERIPHWIPIVVRFVGRRLLIWICLTVIALCPVHAVAGPPRQTEVIIVGAGLSGLATAYELKKAHVPYHILEIAPRIGGRVRTVRYHRPGQPETYADSGMEEYWQSNPAVQVIKELKLKHSSDVAVSSIMLEKRLYPLPKDVTPAGFKKMIFSPSELEALNAFAEKFGPKIKELKPGAVIRPDLMALKDISFAEFVGQQKLPSKVSEWIRVSIECEIGTAWHHISALDGLAEYHIFLGEGEDSYRIVGGNDKFTDALAKAVGRGHISLNSRVTRVFSRPNEAEVQFLETESNENGVIRGKYVVSTIPLFRLFEVQFVPALSPKKREAINGMAWGSYFKAHVFLPAKAVRFWTANDSSILPILSDSELGVIYDGNPQQDGPTKILSLLVHGDAAENDNMVPLDQTRKQIVDGLDKLWPGIKSEIEEIEFYRYHPRAIAAWPVGRSRFDDLSNEIRRPENNVYLAGDFTESSHSDGAFISAHRVVAGILQARATTKSNGSAR